MRAYLILAIFLVCVGMPLAIFAWRVRKWGLPVRVRVDPEDPRPEDLVRYFVEIAQRLDARPQRMRLVFDGRNTASRALALDVLPDRKLRVSVEGHRAQTFGLRARWIADHPVPLDLRRAVLYVDPVDANRFRVMSKMPFEVPLSVYVVCFLMATFGLIFLVPELIVASVGVPVGIGIAVSLRGL